MASNQGDQAQSWLEQAQDIEKKLPFGWLFGKA